MIEFCRRTLLYRFIGLAACALCYATLYVPEAEGQSSLVFVEVSATKVRPEPKFWSPGKADVVYGAPLTVLSSENGWVKVRTESGVEGFVNASAVTERKVALAAGSKAVRIKADDSDVVLAGKGFNDQIESTYRASHTDLDFKGVDAVQKYTVSDAELGHFIESGKLRNQ